MRKIAKIVMGTIFIASVFQPSFKVKAEHKAEVEQLIIKYKDENRLSSKEKQKLQLDTKETSEEAELVEVTERDTEAVIKKLEADENIEYIVQNTRYQIAADEQPKTDTYINKQWNLQTINGATTWSNLQNTTKRVKVAIVDTGINSGHEDLKGRILSGATFLNEENDGKMGIANDDQGHGTALAGIIAANANNGIGISGITGNTNVDILPVKVMDSEGFGDSYYISKGIDYAVEQGADIINLSISGDYNLFIEDSINEAYKKGVLVVAAAGNGGGNADLFFPGALEHVISVGSVTQQEKVFERSNTGSTVDLVAPGVNILSTSLALNKVMGHYAEGTGTSYATPHITAVAALYKLKYPQAKAIDMRIALENTAKDIEANGRDDKSGYGIVNADAALAYVLKEHTIPKITNVAIKNNTTVASIKTEAFAEVTLSVGGVKYFATANSAGVATFKIAKPTAGKTWTVTTKNKFEESSKSTGKVADKIAPKITSVSAANNTTKITVKTEKSAQVKLTISKKSYTKKANASGVATFTIKKPAANTTWKVIATDAAKNAATKTGKVKDKIAPKAVKLTKTLKSTSTQIVGKAEKNSTITIYRNSKKYKSVKATSKGNFKVKIAKQKKNTKISIYSKDKAGNQSKALKVTIK